MANRLQNQTSPYLLQHANNPVDWYPWGEEAFKTAEKENKPIFLSIGYSTCHWCHVMARESFENKEIAQLLNRYFVSIKVDREERPDVDQVYMSACQAMTGSGGWPTSLFLAPNQKPFFAGTYFPPRTRRGVTGFYELLLYISRLWDTDKEKLLRSADEVTAFLSRPQRDMAWDKEKAIDKAVKTFKKSYDKKNGGFGYAPKFPTPHNLLFLMLYGKTQGDQAATDMALHTLKQMRKGGIYDHVGGGFSRYSTDEFYLVPHFEKMLYDNALLTIAYCAAYKVSGQAIFIQTAEEVARYVLAEMTCEEGGFYSAQDADSEGGEGAYYVFDYDEILCVLGKERGEAFNEYYNIKKEGNFEGKNIVNRLHGELQTQAFFGERQQMYRYRLQRMQLHLDDKILLSWNSLMIMALTYLYRVSGDRKYLHAAQRANEYIERNLLEEDTLYVSIRKGKRSGKGFLDDYAYYCAALLALYGAGGENVYLQQAKRLCRVAVSQFRAPDGGFFMSGKQNEKLIFSAKETYDSALPSGNSVFGFVLVRLSQLDDSQEWETLEREQREFLMSQAAQYPAGHTVFLLSELFYQNIPPKIVVVCHREEEQGILCKLPLYADVQFISDETQAYKRINGKPTFYVCVGQTCLSPTNDVTECQRMMARL